VVEVSVLGSSFVTYLFHYFIARTVYDGVLGGSRGAGVPVVVGVVGLGLVYLLFRRRRSRWRV
jgi:hypothetical protein